MDEMLWLLKAIADFSDMFRINTGMKTMTVRLDYGAYRMALNCVPSGLLIMAPNWPDGFMVDGVKIEPDTTPPPLSQETLGLLSEIG